MRGSANNFARSRRGFTLLELQVALVLLAFSMVTLASLMATQQRLVKRVRGNFTPSGSVYLTRSKDPWVATLNTPARITATAITPTAPASVTVANTVTIVSQEADLKTETITVTADVQSID